MITNHITHIILTIHESNHLNYKLYNNLNHKIRSSYLFRRRIKKILKETQAKRIQITK